MKKLAILLFILVFGVSSVFAKEELTGDQKTACEMILCLPAIGSPPAQCASAIKKYFSLVAKRKSISKFLKKCPQSGVNISDILDYLALGGWATDYDEDENEDKDDNTAQKEPGCTAQELNDQTERQSYSSQIRTVATLPESCKGSTNGNLQYTCDKKWYDIVDWERGSEILEVAESKYNEWIVSGKHGYTNKPATCNNTSCTKYYIYVPITKICWKNTGDKPDDTGNRSDGDDPYSPGTGDLSGILDWLSSTDNSPDDTSSDSGDETDDEGVLSDDDDTEDDIDDISDSDDSSGSTGNDGGGLGSFGYGSGGFGGLGGSYGGGDSGNEGSDEDDDEESDEDDYDRGNETSKQFSDWDNYGNYSEIVKQVLDAQVSNSTE
jgi:uncharacterized membrane protein YgcG